MADHVSTLVELVIGADPATWTACGFTVDRDDPAGPSCTIGLVRLRFVEGPAGIASLGIAGGPEPLPRSLDGVPLHVAEPPAAPAPGTAHRNGATAIDHVVVLTPDLDRTIDAVVDGLGAPLRRIRDAGPVRQAFFRLGEPILEVVATDRAADDVATAWGLVATVADLDAAVELLGPDRLGPARTAVQPGRRIATVRAEAGLGTAVAVMSPHVRPG
jgi:catechol 2,3-dioxygenase-like lactoylglutathione lyase family enzyme